METRVVPRSEAPGPVTRHGYDENPPETLFNQREVAIYPTVPDDYPEQPPNSLVTQMWTFLPPPDARATLASTGSLRLTARQGDRTATITQPIPIPQEPEYTSIERNGASRLVLYGFQAGAEIPVGLYSNDTYTSAKLIRRVATVKMPDSRVADFQINTRTLLEDQPTGHYCLLPPINEETDCYGPTKWPDYPGPIEEGDRGKRVKVWQKILIQAEVIKDSRENRDGYYGPATVAAVQQLVSNRWPQIGNPDGGTTLGRGFYEVLTGQ